MGSVTASDASRPQPWLEFAIEGADLTQGIDAQDLASLIRDLATGARVIADEKLSLPGRRGRMSAHERSLAGLRVRGLSPGSAVIEFAEPPPVLGGQLSFVDGEITPTDVARELLDGLEAVTSGTADALRATPRRARAFANIVRSAGRLGQQARASLHSDGEKVAEVTLLLRVDAAAPPSEPALIEQITMFGHVYMADVEMGRQRVRVKLPGERDLTLDVSEEILDQLPAALGQIVQLQVSEARVGGEVVERVVGSFRILESEERGGSTPTRSLTELAREQGLLMRPVPDYSEIVDEMFPTEQDAEEFRASLIARRASA